MQLPLAWLFLGLIFLQVIEELLATEFIYVNDLKTLKTVRSEKNTNRTRPVSADLAHRFTFLIPCCQVFYNPLIGSTDILPKDEFLNIFSVRPNPNTSPWPTRSLLTLNCRACWLTFLTSMRHYIKNYEKHSEPSQQMDRRSAKVSCRWWPSWRCTPFIARTAQIALQHRTAAARSTPSSRSSLRYALLKANSKS